MTNLAKTKTVAFFSQFPHQHLRKGTVFLHPDDKPGGVYYIKTGHARMYFVSSHGIEITLHIFNPESFFPMTWILNDIPNRYYFEAFTDMEVHLAPKKNVASFLKNEPEVVLDLTKRIFNGVDKLSMRIEHMAQENSYSKVASILLYLSRHFGIANNHEVHFKHAFTHQDIGSLVGISRETATRALGKLRRKGIILSNKKSALTISDIAKLESESSIAM